MLLARTSSRGWDDTITDQLTGIFISRNRLKRRSENDWHKIAFHKGWLWVDMSHEGPEHARFSDLITAIFFLWAFLHPEEPIESFGRCLIESPETHACEPDLVLYKGDNVPQRQLADEAAPTAVQLSTEVWQLREDVLLNCRLLPLIE